MMRSLTEGFVPDRRPLGWVSLGIWLAAVRAFVAATPTWSNWWGGVALGLAEVAAAMSWYARGRNGFWAAVGGVIGALVLVVSLIQAVTSAI